MKPSAFSYARAEHKEHAVALKGRYGPDARFLAGGQSLVPAMNYRLVQPAVLIDINRAQGLGGIEATSDGGVRLGATVRHAEVGRSARLRDWPLLAMTMRHVAHYQIRNRGTLGGNLAHADPASEMPAALLALDARVQACSAKGERWIAMADFCQGIYSTALDDSELLAQIEIPRLPPGARSCFLEVARRRGDFAMMGVAVLIARDEAERCSFVRIALCNAGPGPVLARKAMAMLHGQRLADDILEAAATAAADEIDPPGSLQATPAFQRHLAEVLTRRALGMALADDQGEHG